MKVKIISSWNDPLIGKTYQNGTIIDIDAKYFQPHFHEKVKTIKPKTKK